MERYEPIEIEVIVFNAEDVITASPGSESPSNIDTTII